MREKISFHAIRSVSRIPACKPACRRHRDHLLGAGEFIQQGDSFLGAEDEDRRGQGVGQNRFIGELVTLGEAVAG